uniref:Aldo/keto reductase family oxidoreductase,putative n=1 Tax=Neospora caninum (strain Liverpool) TaxID=572307 RepID=A0A0F7UDZ5_NEOCL|nr:TPA: aldo/keto reductase family oxidoreductase,putative [Neospora caninum Liverpool]
MTRALKRVASRRLSPVSLCWSCVSTCNFFLVFSSFLSATPPLPCGKNNSRDTLLPLSSFFPSRALSSSTVGAPPSPAASPPVSPSPSFPSPPSPSFPSPPSPSFPSPPSPSFPSPPSPSFPSPPPSFPSPPSPSFPSFASLASSFRLCILSLIASLVLFSLLPVAFAGDREPQVPRHPSVVEAVSSVPSFNFLLSVGISAFIAAGVVLSLGRAISPVEMTHLAPLSRSLFLPAYTSFPSRGPAGQDPDAQRPSGVHTAPASPPSALGRRRTSLEAEDRQRKLEGDGSSASALRREGDDRICAGDERGSPGRGGAVEIPRLLYGTAWKKEHTERLIKHALLAGFTGVDTACQPKHYDEPGVGRGIQAFLRERNLSRSSLFIQTKFTPLEGQDRTKPLPYNPHASVHEQVQQSLQTSLANLKVDYLDSVLLHSPLRTLEKTLEAWRSLEEAVDEGVVRLLGVSNCYDVEMLRRLYAAARHKPRVLQNRFYPDTRYDKEIRKFCQEHSVVYEAFWTLTANPHMLRSTPVREAARSFNCTPAQAWFRYLLEKGLVVLTGTTSETHMREDLDVLNLDFSQAAFDAVDSEVERFT